MIVSPCINICKSDPITNFCYGCARNTEEKIKQLKNQAIKDVKNASVNIAIESIEKLLLNSLDKSKLKARQGV